MAPTAIMLMTHGYATGTPALRLFALLFTPAALPDEAARLGLQLHHRHRPIEADTNARCVEVLVSLRNGGLTARFRSAGIGFAVTSRDQA